MDFILNNATDLLNNGLLVSRATPPIARGKGSGNFAYNDLESCAVMDYYIA